MSRPGGGLLYPREDYNTAAAALLNPQAANTALMGPTSGVPATPTFRAITAADIPSLDAAKITSGVLAMARLVSNPLAADGTKFVRDDGTLAVPSVGSVPWHIDITRNLTGAVNDTVDLGTLSGIGASGHAVVTVRWTQPNGVGMYRCSVPISYDATAGAWQRVKGEYNAFANAENLEVECLIGTSNASFRLRRVAVGSVGTLGCYITIDYYGMGTGVPTWTDSTTTSTSAITAIYANRLKPSALHQSGASNGQALIWNNTTLQWEPGSIGSALPWRVELSRSMSTTIDATIELGSWNFSEGFYIVTAVWSQANGVSTKRWALGVNYNCTGGAWQLVQPIVHSLNGTDDVSLEVNVSTGATAFRLRRKVLGSAGTLGMNITMQHEGNNLPTFTPSSTTSTSAVTTYYTDLLRPSGLAQQGATNGQALVWDDTNKLWKPGTVASGGGSGGTASGGGSLIGTAAFNSGAGSISGQFHGIVPEMPRTILLRTHKSS